jgi:hypothetical protein
VAPLTVSSAGWLTDAYQYRRVAVRKDFILGEYCAVCNAGEATRDQAGENHVVRDVKLYATVVVSSLIGMVNAESLDGL